MRFLSVRMLVGIGALLLAVAAWTLEEHGQIATLLAGSVGAIILHRELGWLLRFCFRLFTGTGKKLVERAKKVEAGRHCSVCSASIFPIGYRVDTVVRPTRLFAERRVKMGDGAGEPQEQESTYLLSAPKLTVCRRHHPNTDFSNDQAGAGEFYQYMLTKYPHATWERIYPIIVE